MCVPCVWTYNNNNNQQNNWILHFQQLLVDCKTYNELFNPLNGGGINWLHFAIQV